jgi:hypothetical protein
MVYGGSLNQKLKDVETRGVLKRKIFGGKFLVATKLSRGLPILRQFR